MFTALLASFIWAQQLITSFTTVALLFVAYEYHRRYRLSKISHSRASQEVYNDLRILFLLIGAGFAFSTGTQSSAGLPSILLAVLTSLTNLSAALWAAKVALGRFLPKDTK